MRRLRGKSYDRKGSLSYLGRIRAMPRTTGRDDPRVYCPREVVG
jgi:hypothetical protein